MVATFNWKACWKASSAEYYFTWVFNDNVPLFLKIPGKFIKFLQWKRGTILRKSLHTINCELV